MTWPKDNTRHSWYDPYTKKTTFAVFFVYLILLKKKPQTKQNYSYS